jgi:hypothetical protein
VSRTSLSEAEHQDRDTLIRALAGGADPCDARGVLSQALEALHVELWSAAVVYQAGGIGAGSAHFTALLLNLSERAKALEDFCDEHLDVNFTTSAGEQPDGGAS